MRLLVSNHGAEGEKKIPPLLLRDAEKLTIYLREGFSGIVTRCGRTQRSITLRFWNLRIKDSTSVIRAAG
jgi:hypothetical protein